MIRTTILDALTHGPPPLNCYCDNISSSDVESSKPYSYTMKIWNFLVLYWLRSIKPQPQAGSGDPLAQLRLAIFPCRKFDEKLLIESQSQASSAIRYSDVNNYEQATGLYSNGSKQWLAMFDVVSNSAQSH